MTETICKSKSAALEALNTIAQSMQKGTPRDVLLAIGKWIDENVTDFLMPEETQARLKKIFEGSEEKQKGRAWEEIERSDPAYVPGENIKDVLWKHHKMIVEPEHGAELKCFWNAYAKCWEPCYSWLPVSKRPRP